MSNEITVSMSLSCVNGNFIFPRQGISKQFDQTTVGGATPGTVTIATSSGTKIPLTDIGTEGWAIITNLDETNNVTWGGITVAEHNGLMLPGEGALFRLNPITPDTNDLWMVAVGGACEVLIQVLEA